MNKCWSKKLLICEEVKKVSEGISVWKKFLSSRSWYLKVSKDLRREQVFWKKYSFWGISMFWGQKGFKKERIGIKVRRTKKRMSVGVKKR